MLKKGDKAPNFTLPNKDGENYSLEDFKGKKVVIFFYPKDNTPGCSRQACAFGETMPKFEEKNVHIIGISKDGQESHAKFIEKYSLPFLLLSDENLETIQAYGLWKEKTNFGKTAFGVERTTFLIDEEGIIEKIYRRAKTDTNAQDVLNYLEEAKK
ncbi:MAG: thioredoxin-dependent thiol peroxidase [Defluviitaleaceae bacterium]|nr:thioredoxin-dependent thiol peroxidase [Defluviitaleaceae bacterium]